MKTAALDRRVRKEARSLLREARPARARAGARNEALDQAAREVEAGLAAGDLARVRRGLPRLDEEVAELPRPLGSVAREYAWAFGSLIVLVLGIRAFVVEAFNIPSSSMLPTLETNDYIFVSKFVYGLRVPFVDGKLLARSPDRGEVIVFIQPCVRRDFIKRVVGVAGDRIEVRCGVLHVNGAAVPSERKGVERCELRDQTGPTEVKDCVRYRETHGGFTYDTFYDPARRPLVPEAGVGPADGFPQMTLLPACTSPNQRPGEVVKTREVDEAGPCGTWLHYVVPAGHVFVMGDNRDGSSDSRSWGSVPIENIKGKALFRWLSYRELSWGGIRWSRMGDLVH